MNDPQDLSGVWYGRYVSSSDSQDNAFIALIEETGGAFTGTVTEPDGEGGIRKADISGARTGQALYFTKQYSGRWNHAVRYAGRIDSEGREVSGTWSVDWLVGNFTMEREQFSVEELEADEEEELIVGDRATWSGPYALRRASAVEMRPSAMPAIRASVASRAEVPGSRSLGSRQ